MSQVLIHQYLAQLDVLKKVGGTHRESVVREAFKDLLKGWGRQHDLVFIPEYKLDSATKDTRFVDGALLHELRVPFGYWEARQGRPRRGDRLQVQARLPGHGRAHQADLHRAERGAEDQALRHVCALLPLGQRPTCTPTACWPS